MEIHRASELLELPLGTLLSKKILYELIKQSKVPNSNFWDGPDNAIGNTPQQGINWIGKFPDVKGVIIKTKTGNYADDGWIDRDKQQFRYAPKARKGHVNRFEKANQVILNQRDHGYPLLLFFESCDHWQFQGTFEVEEVMEKFVDCRRI